MLQFKKNILTSKTFTIEEPDTIIQLNTDVLDCNYFGVITLNNKTTKTIQFIKVKSLFKARLSLAEEELPYLLGATLRLLSVSSSFSKESNPVQLNFDIDKIKLTIKQNVSKDLLEFKKDLVQVQSKLEALSLGKLVPNVNIINKDHIKPGMILVAIDNGNFMAAYPFADIITKVNGQVAVDGVVEIDASMIKYNTERTIEEQTKVIAEAIKVQNNTLKAISAEINSLSKKLAELTVKVETHLDNGII